RRLRQFERVHARTDPPRSRPRAIPPVSSRRHDQARRSRRRGVFRLAAQKAEGRRQEKSVKEAIRSEAATSDVAAAVEHYVREAPHAAGEFIDELERAIRHIERHPSSGSPRYAHELDIPQLRHWSLRKFPFALFYIDDADSLVILRCVHMTRDIPATLRDET